MFKIGLKLWSTNDFYRAEALRLFEEGYCHYLELFSVPGSYDATIDCWRGLPIPYLIHAPHSTAGFNFSLPECEPVNKKLAHEALRFADALSAPQVIFHPGIFGTVEETIRQMTDLADQRIVIENKPYWGLGNERCVGYSPEQIEAIMRETGCGFCLDIGHAICAANAIKKEPLAYLDSFIHMGPAIYHLSDGNYGTIYDMHEHLGAGSFPLEKIIPRVPDTATITIETKKNSPSSLADFMDDVVFLRTTAAYYKQNMK